MPLTRPGAALLAGGAAAEQLPVDEQRAAAREGRSQAWREAHEEAQQRAQARRERPRGPWRQRGSRIVRAQVSDEEWARLAARAAERDQPASAYLGELIRAHLTNSD